MSHPPPSRRAAAPAGDRYVFCVMERPRCPRCGSSKLKNDRTLTKDLAENEDEEVHRKRCLDCLHGFILVTEWVDPE